MTNFCMRCGFSFEAHYKSNVCIQCESPKTPGFPTLKETMSLREMKNVSKKRIAEIDRRRILPDHLPDGKYVSGSMVNGKITDRPVDLT